MQRIFALAAFLTFSSATAASNTGPANLISVKSLCISLDDIHLPSGKSVLPENAVEDMFRLVDNKLTAYRIPHKSCSGTYYELYIQLDIIDNGGSSVLYNLSVDIFDKSFSIYKSGVSIYSISTFGRSPTSSTDLLLNNMKDIASRNLDEFAADFARAHP